MTERFVALIPLRGGSKSIVDKNIKEICGRPLCAWVLEAASLSESIDQVYVSTDSEKIKDVVESLNLGVSIIDRPAELASDEASTESVIAHFSELVAFDVLATIQATSPLLVPEDLDNAFLEFESAQYDSMLSAVRLKRFFWSDNFRPINYDPLNRPRRQEFKGTLMENGAFYLTSANVLKQYQCRLGEKIGIYEMPEHTALEIDEPSDWTAIASILESRARQ